MMLRPRDDADQSLVAERLEISPRPDALDVQRDDHGNWVATASFSEPARELSVQSMVEVARASGERLLGPPAPPIRAGSEDARVTDWAREVLREAGWDGKEPPDGQALALLCGAIHQRLDYRRRLETGVQSAWRTIELGSGACRDFAMLMIVAARGFGLPACFASGYVHSGGPDVPGPVGGHTHAWACIRTESQGWIDFDPTSGLAGPQNLIRVALAPNPSDAIPISGVWFGRRADFLGMDVEVDVQPGLSPSIPPPSSEPWLSSSVA